MKAERAQTKDKELPADRRINVTGLQISVCNYRTAVDRILSLVHRGRGGYVCVSTVHMAMEAYDDAGYARMVNRADLVTPDGMPMLWMKKLRGAKNVSQVRGVNLMTRLFTAAEKNGFSVGFYGGCRDTLERVSERLKKEFPRLQISYLHSPPFRPLTVGEEKQTIGEINAARPDILFVGLGCPKQERWMARHTGQLPAVLVGVGAAFDFYAGNVREAPEFMRRVGLEWLFRLTQEPRRLWKRYLIQNPRFVRLALLQLLGLKKFGDQEESKPAARS